VGGVALAPGGGVHRAANPEVLLSSLRPLVLASALVAGCFVHIDRSETTESFPVDAPITAVRFDVESGDVEIRHGETPEVIRTYWGRRPELVAEVTGGVLNLRVDCSGVRACRSKHVVLLPENVDVQGLTGSGDVTVVGALTVDVSTGSGDVEARRVDGEVRVETGSGDVDLAEIGGDVDVVVGSGDVVAQVLYSDRAVVETGSGDVRIEVEEPPGLLTVTTGSGDVIARVPEGPYDLRTHTDSGDVQVTGVKHVPGAEHRIDVETGSGDIVVSAR